MLKLLLYTFYRKQELHSDEMFYVPIFGDRNWKYRHDNFQAIFCTVRLISNFP